jgi:hypothetical protein
MQSWNKSLLLGVLFVSCFSVGSAQMKAKGKRKGELYFSWGYNTEWYTRSNVHVSQPELLNNYTFENIRGHDHKGWDEGLFSKALTIPQYNYRIGYIFNRDKGFGFEINFDHTKFIFAEDQEARLKGTLNGKFADTSVMFNHANGFYYYLNNGANFLLFNFVKRWKIYTTKKNENFKLDFFGKAGIGPVIPHVENSFFGNANEPHFQFGGWNVGAEGSLRATFFKYVYLEYCNKIDYARYSNLHIYKGEAKHAFGTYEMILNLGITFPMGKRESTSGYTGH